MFGFDFRGLVIAVALSSSTKVLNRVNVSLRIVVFDVLSVSMCPGAKNNNSDLWSRKRDPVLFLSNTSPRSCMLLPNYKSLE